MKRLFFSLIVMTVLGSLTVRGLNNLKVEYYDNINHFNLEKVLEKRGGSANVKKICTYDYCDLFRGDSLKEGIEIFINKYLDTINNEETKNSLKIKGVKITKVIFNN